MAVLKDLSRTQGTYRNLRRISKVCACLVFLIGFLALVGWVADIRLLKSIRSDTVPMNPVTALGFLMVGPALYFMQENQYLKRKKLVNRIAIILCGLGGLKLFSL